MPRKERKPITKELRGLILTLFNARNTITHIASTLQLCRQTVANCIKAAENNEEFATAAEKCSKTCRERNSTHSLAEQAIFNTVSCDNSHIQKEIAQKIFQATNCEMSQSTVSRKLRKLNLTRKRLSLVPQERNTLEKIEARAIYASEISRVSDGNLIFLDETGFNEHTKRHYGYSPENTKAYTTVPANRNVNKSLICAIGVEGVIAYMYKVGAFNSDSFMIFIEEQLVPYFRIHPNKVLIMDNARFHKSASILQLLRSNGIACKFLVPYSPELNPIEEFFSMIKSRFCAVRIANRSNTIEECLNIVLNFSNDYSTQCQNFFRNMRQWLEKARRNEPFI